MMPSHNDVLLDVLPRCPTLSSHESQLSFMRCHLVRNATLSVPPRLLMWAGTYQAAAVSTSSIPALTPSRFQLSRESFMDDTATPSTEVLARPPGLDLPDDWRERVEHAKQVRDETIAYNKRNGIQVLGLRDPRRARS